MSYVRDEDVTDTNMHLTFAILLANLACSLRADLHVLSPWKELINALDGVPSEGD